MKSLFLAFIHWLTAKPAISDPTIPSEHSGVFGTPTPQPSDWVKGRETGIVEKVRNSTGDWRPFLSPGKWQRDIPGGTYFETDACMSFAVIDSVQAQLNFMIKFGLISDTNVQWLKNNGYFDADGLVNLSPRFTAKMSGTTMNGNTYQNVWGSARNDGLVPESSWPAHFDLLVASPSVQGQTQANWNTYYAAVFDTAVALGKEFAKRIDIQYEWVNHTGSPIPDRVLQEGLSLAPLHITTAVCMPWNSSAPINGCGIGTAHATLLTDINGNRHIRDHYVPFDKTFAIDYAIPYAVRGVVVEKIAPRVPVHFTHTFATPYKLGDTATEIQLLQNILKLEGCMPLTVASSGYYGPITALAVGKFQAKFGVSVTSPNNIGPKTLALFNQAAQG